MNKIILITMLAFLGLSSANAQVGIGTTTPDASAALDLTATDKGFLPPRMSTAQRNVINGGNPAVGLVIYNTDINCLQWWGGSVWYNACDGTSSDIIADNATCATATISVTPCSAVPGATLSASQPHADGTLYDWIYATSYMGGSTTAALVEIGGQCWFKRNTLTPTQHTGTNDFDGFYNDASSELAVGDGRLYQWQAAMNNSTTERAQGVCPTGWHIPSDCEWMYLENTLGMTVAEQEGNTFRGTEGLDLSELTDLGNGTNSSGFTGLLTGNRSAAGGFNNRGIVGRWWSSTEIDATTVRGQRAISRNNVGVRRDAPTNKAIASTVRCLKD